MVEIKSLVLGVLTLRCSLNFQLEMSDRHFDRQICCSGKNLRMKNLTGEQSVYLKPMELNEFNFEVSMCPGGKTENRGWDLTHCWLRQEQFQWMGKA